MQIAVVNVRMVAGTRLVAGALRAGAGLALALSFALGQIKPPTYVTDLVMVGRSPAIHAMVDGHDALLELDTGSFELRLSPSYKQKWKLDDHKVALKIGSSPAMVMRPLVEELSGPESSALPSGFAPHSDGIVGLDVLRRFAVGLDNVNGRVALWYGGNVDQKSADAWAEGSGPVPRTSNPVAHMAKIELLSKGPDDWYRVRGTVNGMSLDLLLDTGTAYSTVNPSLASPLGLKVIGTTPVQEIGHSESLRVAMADSIGFGPFTADFPVLNIESEEDPDVQGILGTEALGNGKFLIDMPGLKFYVTRLKSKRGNPLERRMREAGIDLFPTPSNELMTLVRPGSSADKLGISSGDRLVSIGDVDVAEFFGERPSESDSTRFKKLMGVGLKAIDGDLHVLVMKKAGNLVDVPLPK